MWADSRAPRRRSRSPASFAPSLHPPPDGERDVRPAGRRQRAFPDGVYQLPLSCSSFSRTAAGRLGLVYGGAGTPGAGGAAVAPGTPGCWGTAGGAAAGTPGVGTPGLAPCIAARGGRGWATPGTPGTPGTTGAPGAGG